MNEDQIKHGLETKFHQLKDKVMVQRPRRIWADVEYSGFHEVFHYAVEHLGFTVLCTITGLDEGADLGYIYHMSKLDGTTLNIKTRAAKDSPISTITDIFPAAAIYERELEDLLGARVDGLPKGVRYPLPDDWPAGNYPLRKDWDQSVLDKGNVGRMDENA